MKQPIEHGAYGLRVRRRGVCFFHLPENLRFADDQRIEAGGDAEQVPCGFEIGEVVEMRREVADLKTVEITEKAGEVGLRAGERGNRVERTVDAARLKVDALAQLDRRGAMTDPDEKEMHLFWSFCVLRSSFFVLQRRTENRERRTSIFQKL